jgi:hypothetical protein
MIESPETCGGGGPAVIATVTRRRRTAGQAVAGRATGAGAAASVAGSLAAVDILHHQPEQPGFARARHRTRSVPTGRRRPRLTSLANVGSDDLAVIRHASPPWQK